MKHYLYKTTNTLNGRYYVGRHSTETTDNYLGSGVILHKAIKKYGIENFTVEILHYYDTYETLIEAEKNLVESVLLDPLSYNIGPGGPGGSVKEQWDDDRKNKHSEIMSKIHATVEFRRKVSKSISDLHKSRVGNYWTLEGIEAKRKMMKGNTHKLGKKESAETCAKKSAAHKGVKRQPFTEEHKKNISKNLKGKRTGLDNPMASAEAREKVAASKRGRKKVWREDGTFFWQKPDVQENS
jgi:hypothetical protein